MFLPSRQRRVNLAQASDRAEVIGVGRADWFRLPLPPNRTGGSPASGSPVGGLTFERIDMLAPGQMLTRTSPRHLSKPFRNGVSAFQIRFSLFLRLLLAVTPLG